MWPVFTGRKDGNVSLAAEVGVNLPSANANFTTLLAQFQIKGLEIDDLVTLSGKQFCFLNLNFYTKLLIKACMHKAFFGYVTNSFVSN